MACIINASTSNGLVNSADGSGIVKLQSNGVATNALAWVNFNGTGTVAIRSSYNVSSITDNGTGKYVVNFTTAMSDLNYNFATTGTDSGGATAIKVQAQTYSGQTTSALPIEATNAAGSAYNDLYMICVQVFGN